MAHSIVPNVYVNGESNLVINTCIVGDGSSGELSATQFIDVSTYGVSEVKIKRIKTSLVGFSAILYWDADTDVPIISVPDYEFGEEYHEFGGLWNNAGDGKTGDIMISTFGLASSSNEGHIIVELEKGDA